MRTYRAERIEFDSTKKIREDSDAVVVPAILTRESILPFADGKGYRSAKELADAAWTLEGAWVVAYDHILTVFPMSREDIRGRIQNVSFDSTINGVRGEIRFIKALCDEKLLADVKRGNLKDVSVAYFSEDVFESGTFAGEPYDFVQRNFMFGHVAAGVPEGRCPSPFCGMNVDSFKPHKDPEESEDFIHIRVDDPEDFVESSFRTIDIDAEKGIRAVVGKLKSDPKGSMHIQKFIFEKAKGWTMEKAEAWVQEHKDSMDAEWTTEYINDLPDSAFAYIEPGGEKDEDGKTVPRSKRHLPYKNAQGEIDHDHLVNALARVKQSETMPEGGKRSAIEKLCAAVRSWNREHEETKIESEVCGTEDSVCTRLNPYEELARSRKYFHSNMSLFGTE